ncbi:putative Ig domain-containing protein [Paenibacillus donghaensis]|uniref:Peptidase S8 n=1 Tax=Paenibacillus donghaensis TaxID=414771 RepID=A0A2Z2KES7_9BACL|nr:CBM35 domain-containing protein [Paenibacillus donghaensis]ASA22425.1 peptidase S8 [Paenibacillus donghaensis]
MRRGISLLLCSTMVLGLTFVNGAAGSKVSAAAANELSVIDIFEREVNGYGIDLVDWQGYLANPYIKLTVKPPANAVYPVTVTLQAEGSSRLMMDLPSTLSAGGATKTLKFTNAAESKNFLLEIAPDRVGAAGSIENYTLSMQIRDNNGSTRTQTMPIRVLDQDDNTDSSFPLVFDYRYDTVNHYFDDPGTRAAAERAIKDYFYFLDISPFDTVPAGDEVNIVPNDNFNGNTTVSNNAPFKGEWIFLRGINDPYSTGWSSNNGKYHKINGVNAPGNLHRSLGTALDFYANANVFTSINDDDWYKTDLSQVTDVYGLIMHEFGHGFAYSDSWPGMVAYYNSNGTNDPEVIAYQGHAVKLDNSYHIPGDQASWDRISGQSGGWNHLFPTRRWLPTKLSLLIAENAGWKLNKNLTPFLAPSITTSTIPNGTLGQSYTAQLAAKGGVPFYDWTLESGSLPPGLSLNRFTGVISGTVASGLPQSTYNFTVKLRDYDEASAPVLKSFVLNLGGGTTPAALYEAESATVNNANVNEAAGASAGKYVGQIDYTDSYVQFAVQAAGAGPYNLEIRYANGTGTLSTQSLNINNGAVQTLSYPATAGWGQFGTVTTTVHLNNGANAIRLSKGTTGYAELDYIRLTPVSQ